MKDADHGNFQLCEIKKLLDVCSVPLSPIVLFLTLTLIHASSQYHTCKFFHTLTQQKKKLKLKNPVNITLPHLSTLMRTISLSPPVFLACGQSLRSNIAFLLTKTAATFSWTAFAIQSIYIPAAFQSSLPSIRHTPLILWHLGTGHYLWPGWWPERKWWGNWKI